MVGALDIYRPTAVLAPSGYRWARSDNRVLAGLSPAGVPPLPRPAVGWGCPTGGGESLQYPPIGTDRVASVTELPATPTPVGTRSALEIACVGDGVGGGRPRTERTVRLDTPQMADGSVLSAVTSSEHPEERTAVDQLFAGVSSSTPGAAASPPPR